MKRIIALVFVSISLAASSQSKDKAFKPQFRLAASGGIAIGEKNTSPVFQVVPALYYKKFSAGVGSGVDFYRFRSIPLFADLRYNFGRRDPGFVYANAGYSFPFVKSMQSQFKTTDIYKGGFYGDFGIGYRFLIRSKHAFLFSTGYSIKKIENTVGMTYWTLLPTPTEDLYNYHYSMGRIVTKLSWEFGRR